MPGSRWSGTPLLCQEQSTGQPRCFPLPCSRRWAMDYNPSLDVLSSSECPLHQPAALGEGFGESSSAGPNPSTSPWSPPPPGEVKLPALSIPDAWQAAANLNPSKAFVVGQREPSCTLLSATTTSEVPLGKITTNDPLRSFRDGRSWLNLIVSTRSYLSNRSCLIRAVLQRAERHVTHGGESKIETGIEERDRSSSPPPSSPPPRAPAVPLLQACRQH